MPSESIRIAGIFLAVSAMLHLLAFIVTGFTSEAQQFIVVGFIWGAIAWGLLQGFRWLAWIAFVVTLIGLLVAYIGTGNSTIPDWWLMLIVFTDLGVVVFLFAALWRRAT